LCRLHSKLRGPPLSVDPTRCPRIDHRRRAALIGASLLLTAAGPSAIAQENAQENTQQNTRTDLGEIDVRAARDIADPPAPGTAAYSAPSRAPLDAKQPTSVVGQEFISRDIIPTQNYDSIIRYTPSVQNVEPVGPGLQQNFYETIRGFTYKQYNTTFDGIVVPGTVTSFAPQSGAYFMAHDIGSVEVDRGPGTASTIGYATFGGTVSIRTKPPADTFTVNPYVSGGSYNTHLEGVQLDSGALPRLGGARGFADIEALDSDGYLTGTSTRRRNAFIKFEAPIGASNTVTFVAVGNTSFTHTPIGATIAQINLLGANYGLNNDPRSQAYSSYNVDYYSTDFEYVKINSDLGAGFKLEDTPYTASYFHHGLVGLDPNGTSANLTGTYFLNGAATRLTNEVPGRAVHSDFRDVGNILRVTKDTSLGQARVGLWLDHNSANAYRTNVLLSAGDAPYTKTATATPYDYRYRTGLTTVQPYIEFAATPLPGLVITPGLKYTSTTRDLNAPINQGTKVSAQFSKTYDALQPSIDARYTVNPSLVGYVQVAKGFLAPPLGVLQTTAPQQLNPQETTNYQVGGTWQRPGYTLSADAYWIDFSNKISSQTVNGTTLYFNGGGAVYRGIELEGTVRMLPGLSLYANGTINDASYNTTGIRVAATPEKTAAIGPLYDKDGLSALLIAKYIGFQYGQDTPVNAYPIKPYATVDFAAGYTLPILNRRKLDFRLNVNNLFDNHSLTFLNQLAADGKTGLYFTNPGRSVFFSVSASL